MQIRTRLKQWREGLHGLTLGWLGAVIVVVVLGAAVIFLLATTASGPSPSRSDQIRSFYGSHAGGDAPPAAVAALQIEDCNETGETTRAGFFLYVCVLTYGDREYFACFSFDIDGRLREGGLTLAGLTSDCDVVLYDRRVKEFRKLRSPV